MDVRWPEALTCLMATPAATVQELKAMADTARRQMAAARSACLDTFIRSQLTSAASEGQYQARFWPYGCVGASPSTIEMQDRVRRLYPGIEVACTPAWSGPFGMGATPTHCVADWDTEECPPY